ncbi:MAG: dockerin type I repeat-containing protein [candidate division Zixibacteria bacterium]|nr:dockerin type I repeat-containing protein [candidate division Zixibacteria bacterium]
MRSYQPLTSFLRISAPLVFVALLLAAGVFAQDTCEFYKPGFHDYCPNGVPDFDQKQTNLWQNPLSGFWSWDGPAALADCMWWFDSKFEIIPVDPRPFWPDQEHHFNDFYPLVFSLDPEIHWDDHDTNNAFPFITRLGSYCNVDDGEGTIPGTTIWDLEQGFHAWLENEVFDLMGYTTRVVVGPDFEEIRHSVTACQNVILLLGFYEEEVGLACRWLGNHYVTVAGVSGTAQKLCISDPYFDHNEGEPPVGASGHGPTVHNNAANISGPHGTNYHDCYQASPSTADLCLSPATWMLTDYPNLWTDIENFAGMNPLNPELLPGQYLGGNILVLIEAALFITQEMCAGTGDVNNNGITLEIADMIFLFNYVLYGTPVPVHLWVCDLNGDNYIDGLDVELYQAYHETGLSVFLPYGGFPVPNNCCPVTVHGACCNFDTCRVLSPENCRAAGGYYMGDGTTCEPDACYHCCIGFTGNVDCSKEEEPDISDITRLIDYLYITHSPLCCWTEADVNVSGGQPDISDITRLIDYLYLSHDPLPDCPE